ncbi:AAA family ATPase [Pseudomonas mediterranea]|jgi:predicted ATPase/DNA-binding winged helix-turn-helix (wHTH) protein|uniref:Predicted ATPase n=1 Tax=Pseudomonas mediterranea TaxID=183795 RepID=A0AAX2DE10_9PSED|nr:winged helix-turn-helix domain-containing protein [Pseudomonas mediterranea]KGU85979.1 transcriptional regulator [Pseudomonas mediterranea CFBP 5447]MBL0843023.1 helix-turn-helix transcriptional regulator [Pseudomonas mediterranea]MDU9028741.1 winged helix-turn-helix domain-containing protein [Pseudomonas mediterranea]QHA83427.1 AAA family ATPase [Pseudomonas mediterranea]UZD99257.1 helix-turn-helix transcriptional regulator [Pseudomonas mediterranea]
MNSFIKPDTEMAVGFGPFAFYRQQRLVTRNGEPLTLGGRALDVLQVLVDHAGSFISKQALIAEVWPDSVVEDINLRVHIAALRRAFGEGRDGCRYILNDPRRGYCFAAPLASSIREKHNLPARLSPVIGRDKVLGRLLAEVPRQRLTTVTGPGGVGKSTVVLRVAELLLEHFDDGAWFVDLAATTEPCQVRARIACTLGLEPDTLNEQLERRRMLLVLDGCERQLEACRELALALRASTAGVSLLLSSREPLSLTDEHIVQLPGLTVASPLEPEQQLLACPAVQLLKERVGARQQGFKPSDRDLVAMAQICQRLDGLPLALELAAAQVSALGVAGVLEQLEFGLSLLSFGRRTAVPRHRSLEALLDWSFERLSAPEQRVFQRLAVFDRPFTAKAAIAVISCPELGVGQLPWLLSRLANQSLLRVEECASGVRFHWLNTTRAYAEEKLRRSGQWHLYHRRYVLQGAWKPVHSSPALPRQAVEQRVGLH